MGGTYFDDEQEIGPEGVALLRKVLEDLFVMRQACRRRMSNLAWQRSW